ncbi:MAG TPA: fibro-slime domain-containing protein [Polyangiaceae bacterium]|nr:fibro-slime domain-containing protein [Polyangiaceae bacterium]
MRWVSSVRLLLAVSPLALACSAAGTARDGVNGAGIVSAAGSASSGGGSSSTPPSPSLSLGGELDDGNASSQAGAATGGMPVEILTSLPDGFIKAATEKPEDASRGGYRVLGALADVPPPKGECGNILRTIVRDFQGSHDDFENASDWNRYDVASPIGPSRKPEKTSTTGPLHFEQWYQNLPDVNQPFAVDLWLEPVGETFVFDSTAFLPLADWGYKDTYSFTTELHTNFEYKGGEVFTFRGDDDVFVFVNGFLGVNLSGVHTAQEGSIDLDAKAAEFGLEIGKSYTFDLFQAERQPTGSNFRLETTLSFTGCGVILPPDIIVK